MSISVFHLFNENQCKRVNNDGVFSSWKWSIAEFEREKGMQRRNKKNENKKLNQMIFNELICLSVSTENLWSIAGSVFNVHRYESIWVVTVCVFVYTIVQLVANLCVW